MSAADSDAPADSTALPPVGRLHEMAGVFPNDLILEIGCGAGESGKLLGKECLHWFGVDIAAEMLRRAARLLHDLPNITLVELAKAGLEAFPNDSIDLIYGIEFFRRFPERDLYIGESHRVLRPGGRCFFESGPLDAAPTRDEWAASLAKAGFDNVLARELPGGGFAAAGRKSESLHHP
jgi:ubiquinone/menaquinone biosynthesis C-methylase UbiE